MKILLLTLVSTLTINGQISKGYLSNQSLGKGVKLVQISTTPTQAVLNYENPSLSVACSLQVADMQRQITVASISQVSSTVTVTTSNIHGLVVGSVIYPENSGVPGWQTVLTVPSSTTFTFTNSTSGWISGGNIGVLVDDVNPGLFTNANLDSRAGNTLLTNSNGVATQFILGKHSGEIGLDGNRYSRALQAFARHHYTINCNGTIEDGEFVTSNIPVGDTFNPGIPTDPANPGQYGYPTIQWTNPGQALIDPFSGVISHRATGPLGTASSSTPFGTALDIQGSSWVNPSHAISGGSATFTPPCSSGTCPLFLRADGLNIPGGSSYSAIDTGNSLDWFQPSPTLSISTGGTCTGDDCKVSACLTSNGQTCSTPTKDFILTATPSVVPMGSTVPMDLWQTSGPPPISRPDATEFSGTVNYNSSTKLVTWVSGNYFDLNWTAGSRMIVNGTEYPISSITNEASLTLSSGPGGNLTGTTYSASNFGVLVWKKTSNTGVISIASSVYEYGSSQFPGWGAGALDSCSSASPTITVNGKPGYNCFIQEELFWVSADGSVVNDLGQAQTAFRTTTNWTWGSGLSAAPSAGGGQFDPLNADCWYTTWDMHYASNLVSGSIQQICYSGNHMPVTAQTITPDCALNSGVQPCLAFTNMMPTFADTPAQNGVTFNSAYASTSSTYNFPHVNTIDPVTSTLFLYFGTSINGVGGGQDWPGWIMAYALGNRSPIGTAGGMSIVGMISTFLTAPLSYCTIHNANDVPFNGWAQVSSNNSSDEDGTHGTYNMVFSGGQAPLTSAIGGGGGLNSCPTNVLSVTGVVCTNITTTTQPTRQSDSVVQNLQVQDVILIDNESMRVVLIVTTSPLVFWVQRGYAGSTVASHSATTVIMGCGTVGTGGAKQGLWNYTMDPLGTNTGLTTLTTDPTLLGGHHYISPVATGPVSVSAAGAQFNLGIGTCPIADTVNCTQARLGNLVTATTATSYGIATGPAFAGIQGLSPGNGEGGNGVDSHPGPCFNFTCFDAHPFNGGLDTSTTNTGQPFLGDHTTPFTLVTGQLWKISGANSVLHRKFLTTFAYVGRNSLIDVSGPSSSIGTTSGSQFTYCYANLINECRSGSSIGDVYVNAPFVQFPWCWYPGIANQPDDVTGICIGDLGSHTASVIEYTVGAANNWTGTTTRRLGPQLARWNQFNVFQNMVSGPSLTFFGNYARWLDGVRNDALVGSLPNLLPWDGIDRTTFIPQSIVLTAPGGLSITTALIEFGYSDYGASANFYCTSRQETCVSVSNSIGSTPFWYETSDSGSFSRISCVTTCNLVLPGLPEKVLYWRAKYYNGSGTLVSTGSANAIATP